MQMILNEVNNEVQVNAWTKFIVSTIALQICVIIRE